MEAAFIDPDLGLEALRTCTQAGEQWEMEDGYWSAVQDHNRVLVKGFRPEISNLVLTGTAASDPGFHDAIKAAMGGLVLGSVVADLDKM